MVTKLLVQVVYFSLVLVTFSAINSVGDGSTNAVSNRAVQPYSHAGVC